MSGKAAKRDRRTRAADQPAGTPLEAVRWANYHGDHSTNIGVEYGPRFGPIYLIVEVDYDEATDMSRVGFAILGLTR